jgi:hypothetical protein
MAYGTHCVMSMSLSNLKAAKSFKKFLKSVKYTTALDFKLTVNY